MGKWLTRLPRLLLVHLRTLRSTPVGTCRRDLQKFPSPRWDFHIFCACACRAAVSLSTAARLPSHRAPSLATQLLECVLMLKTSHRPDGKIADALALILACTSANDASINYRLCVPQRLQKFPSPRWENALPRWDFHMFCAYACRAAVCSSTVAR